MATIRDVARESGVSVATVSYVLNNGPRPVREQTRHRVQEAMRRLNYHPNAMARGLVSRRLFTLGVLFGPDRLEAFTDPFAANLLQGALAAAHELGYNITLFTQPWRNAAQSAPLFRDRRTDGVLLVAPMRNSDMVEGLSGLDLPLVVVSSSGDRPGVPYVDIDNAAGARLATEHLIGLGHERIGHISGDEHLSSVPIRRDAFCKAMRAAGREVRPEYQVSSTYTIGQSYEAIRRLLTLPEPPTALFAGNDMIGITTLAVARDLRIRVPEQLSVIGFDDVPSAALVTPPLTTINQPLARIGEVATRLLVCCIEKPETRLPMAHLEEPTLIVRQSTAAPPLAR